MSTRSFRSRALIIVSLIAHKPSQSRERRADAITGCVGRCDSHDVPKIKLGRCFSHPTRTDCTTICGFPACYIGTGPRREPHHTYMTGTPAGRPLGTPINPAATGPTDRAGYRSGRIDQIRARVAECFAGIVVTQSRRPPGSPPPPLPF